MDTTMESQSVSSVEPVLSPQMIEMLLQSDDELFDVLLDEDMDFYTEAFAND